MRVVLDARTATDHFPGIGRYVVHLARGLREVAPDLDLVLLADPSARAMRLTLPAGAERATCPVSPFSLSQQWRVPALLRGLRPDIYHSAYYLMPYRPGVPTVVTCYDVIPLAYPAYFGAAQRLIFRAAHGLALRTASVILAISQATARDLRRYFAVDPGRVRVTPLAAGSQFHPVSQARVGAMREKYGLPERYFLYFGSNKPHKNLARLVEAWGESIKRRTSNVMRDTSDVTLIIAGHWEERYPEARLRARGVGKSVRFLGPVAETDLPALYGGARWFVFPSLHEGFGLPVLEAMRCGTPVICSDSSSLPEVAGDAGLPVDPRSIESIAAALARAVEDEPLRDRMAERGLAQAARFSWEHTGEETIAAYRSLGAEGACTYRSW